MPRSSPKPPVALILPALLVAVASLTPLAYLFDTALDRGLSELWKEVWRRRTLELTVRSLLLALSVTLASVLIAVPTAWAVTRSNLPFRRLWRTLLSLPLAVPSYLAAFAWISWRPSLAGFEGAFLVLTMVSYPYVFLPVAAALAHLDPALEEIAVLNGKGRPLQLIALSVRQVRSSIATGSLLVALYVLSDFGAVATMRYDAFTWVIYGAYRAGFNPSRAAILAVVLVLIAIALVFAERFGRGRRTSKLAARSIGTTVRLPLSHPVLASIGVSLVVAVSLAFPVWRVVTWVARRNIDIDFSAVSSALLTSLQYSALAALATVACAMPIGILAGRHRNKSAQFVEQATYLTHALPGIVMAIAMVFIGVRLLEPIYLRTPLLIVTYVLLFLPIAVASLRASAEQIPQILDDVAQSLGDRPLAVIRRVVMPLLTPGILSAALLVLLAGMKELPVTMLLHPTGSDTLATKLWTYTSVSDYANAGPYALAIIIFVSIPTAIAVGRS